MKEDSLLIKCKNLLLGKTRKIAFTMMTPNIQIQHVNNSYKDSFVPFWTGVCSSS